MHWSKILILSWIALAASVGCGKRDRLTDPGDGPTGSLPAAQVAAIQGAFALGGASSEFGTDAVQAVAAWVFIASGFNGNQLTTAGTLTQTREGSEDFTYSPTPNDHLVVLLQVGVRTVTLNVFVQAFKGETSGDSTDFERVHSNLAFRVETSGQYDLTVTSQSGAPPGVSPQTNIAYARHITGTQRLEGQAYAIDVTQQGTYFFEVDGQFAEFDRRDTITGQLSGNGVAVNLSESSRGHIISNAGDGITVSNAFRNLNNALTVNGVNFALAQVAIQTELTNGRIAEPDFWSASGTLTRNGETIGSLRFASPPRSGGNHPGLVFDLGSGQTILL